MVPLHDNVVISEGVRLITNSVAHVVFNREENTNKYLCRYGKIENNVYVSADAIIQFDVTVTKRMNNNQSMSTKGVLRGLHFQKQSPQCKLVRAVRGTVFDVAVDLRSNSETYTASPDGFAGVSFLEDPNAKFCIHSKQFVQQTMEECDLDRDKTYLFHGECVPEKNAVIFML